MPSEKRRADPGAVVALFLAQASFATFPVLGKVALTEAAPMAIAACRIVAGALTLTLVARLVVKDDPPSTWRDRGVLAALSALGIVANQTLYILGLARTTAADVALLISTIPVFVLLFGMLLGRERPGWRRAMGIPVALSGTLLLLNLKDLDFKSDSFLGNMLIVLNCLFYSLYLVLARGILGRRSALGVTAAIFRYGAIPILLIAAPSLSGFDPRALSTKATLAIVAIIVFPTILSYLLNTWALARTDASTAAVFHYVQPLMAWTLAWIVLGERPGPRFLAAAGLIFCGLALTTWPARKEAPVEPAPDTI